MGSRAERGTIPLKERTYKCFSCGSPFTPVQANQISCSEECAHDRELDRKRRVRDIRRKTEIPRRKCIFEDCPNVFMPRNPQHLTCSAQCARRLKSTRDKQRRMERRFEVLEVDPIREPTAIVDTEQLIEEVHKRGYFVTKTPQTIDERFEVDVGQFDGNIYRFAVVSDTHLCSIHQQLTHLKSFYRLCAERGIDTVLHCGDVSEGNGKVYVGQQYELFVHGVDKQCSYIEEHYPYEEGVTTYMIAGNHDASFQKSAGHDLLQEITSHRDDLKYLGMFGAYFTIPGLDSTFYLHHPRGPIPYARSYRLQKTIEQMAPDQKPRVLLQGHLHISCHLPMYRNVEGFLVPCFQAQTPLLKAMGVYPTIGGLILELVVNESGLAAVKTEWWPFYVPHEDDY